MQVYTISFFQNVLACNKPRLYLIAWSDEKWKQAVELFKKKKAHKYYLWLYFKTEEVKSSYVILGRLIKPQILYLKNTLLVLFS